MNVLASECSSGCESGWTLYLEQSFHSPNASHRNTKFVDGKGTGFYGEHFEEKFGKEDDQEEDLSMVSDASSGPPNFHEDEAYFNDVNRYQYPPPKATSPAANSAGKRKTKREHRSREKQDQLPSFLDDTASSPVINFSSKNNFALTNNQASLESVLDYSQGFSATHFQGRSAFQDHFGFLQSSHSGNQFQNNQWL